ncbi:MAG: hypothetical protein WBQ25_19675 [Nitrososphaeraceae archaeon]
MKVLMGAVAVLVLLTAMIGEPAVQSVLANKADTEKEAGIGADKQGRPCTFGPSHDECRDQFLERTQNLPTLPPNQHYGECEEDSKGLACDILNDDGSPNPPTLPDGSPNVS